MENVWEATDVIKPRFETTFITPSPSPDITVRTAITFDSGLWRLEAHVAEDHWGCALVLGFQASGVIAIGPYRMQIVINVQMITPTELVLSASASMCVDVGGSKLCYSIRLRHVLIAPEESFARTFTVPAGRAPAGARIGRFHAVSVNEGLATIPG